MIIVEYFIFYYIESNLINDNIKNLLMINIYLIFLNLNLNMIHNIYSIYYSKITLNNYSTNYYYYFIHYYCYY
jgi:hypothetical protein